MSARNERGCPDADVLAAHGFEVLARLRRGVRPGGRCPELDGWLREVREALTPWLAARADPRARDAAERVLRGYQRAAAVLRAAGGEARR